LLLQFSLVVIRKRERCFLKSSYKKRNTELRQKETDRKEERKKGKKREREGENKERGRKKVR